ncbi:hypothetical protein [Fischerella thermalis]|uniref:hypothetical protein n=1 Tax=Fischerella thermalis TaxID=372787 RepID=UPI0015E06B93|nr:hypothetical protein [Fischerella thermalis]MBF1989195.1 hypothetical protein [Fischerella thermalis M58_A2018_009]MBF2062290.1 hypothetical protein [Fischerella thermalis M66_A2018_004]MBF2068994.1 hypothetical protein [Fischerella thermalis M48_A2018_028]
MTPKENSSGWDLRQARACDRKTDLLVMKTMVLFGEVEADNPKCLLRSPQTINISKCG